MTAFFMMLNDDVNTKIKELNLPSNLISVSSIKHPENR